MTILSAPRCRLTGRCSLRQQILKYSNAPLSMKDWKMGISVCSLCTKPWGNSQLLTFSVCYHPVEPMNTIPAGHKSQTIKRYVLWDGSHKSWGIRLGVTQLVTEFLSKGIVTYTTVYSVYSREEMSIGSSYVTILNQNSIISS